MTVEDEPKVSSQARDHYFAMHNLQYVREYVQLAEAKQAYRACEIQFHSLSTHRQPKMCVRTPLPFLTISSLVPVAATRIAFSLAFLKPNFEAISPRSRVVE